MHVIKIYKFIYIYINNLKKKDMLYIYIYIEREREREKLRSSYNQLVAEGGRTVARDGKEEVLTAGEGET
jgi:hypothetical protein